MDYNFHHSPLVPVTSLNVLGIYRIETIKQEKPTHFIKMIWFEGSIPAAIISAKQQSSIFVVVITGDDEVSGQMMSSWEDDRVAEASYNCSWLVFVAGSVSAEELMKRINKVKQMHVQQMAGEGADAGAPMEGLPRATVASEPAPAQTPSTSQDAAAPAMSKESLSRPAEEGGPSASEVVTLGDDRSASSEDVSTSSQPDEGLDAKVERLTKKLEERREQKKKGEEEKEMERRKMGKEMLDFKRKNEDEKTKRIMDERNRDKAEEKAARERVKAQIALDRADRAARYANNKDEVEAARLAALQARQAETQAKKENAQRERSAIARIQFRLPDGSFFTNQFPSEARLQEARQFAVNEVGNRYGNFSLATVFPRREFTADDLDKTLLALELAPSASIVLLPQTGRPNNMVVQSTSGGGIWAVLGTILYPLLAVWRFLSGFLFTSPPIPGAAGPRGPAQRPNTASGSSSSSGEPKRETLRKRTLEKQPADFKQDGKIHRLRNHEDSEDENNTWNGNSTQQM
uniref:UBX domain-containing protein 4 n=1 Tax=Oncorhynchus tshawytscha TaxID=74940 RepID=A0A8C8J6S3_ONCTS